MTRISALAFTALWIVAMTAYPGWNAFDADSIGHSFARNFLCDLLSSTTPDGRSNTVGSTAMNAGALVLVAGGLLPLWWRVPIGEPWRSWARILGTATAILVLALCVEQAFGLSWPHGAITLTAAAIGLVPMSLCAVADWRADDRSIARRTLLLGAIAAALANFVGYAGVQLGGPLTVFVPLAQKVALMPARLAAAEDTTPVARSRPTPHCRAGHDWAPAATFAAPSRASNSVRRDLPLAPSRHAKPPRHLARDYCPSAMTFSTTGCRRVRPHDLPTSTAASLSRPST